MHVPIKMDYAVRALVDLALHGEDRPVRASEIALRAMVPAQYLAQVMHNLSRSDIVKSQRGPQGGHTLAVDPYEVTLSAVLEALGGMDPPVVCLDDYAACACLPSCAQREVWREVDEAVYRILDRTTVGHLVDRTRALQAQQKMMNAGERIEVVAL